MHDVLESVTSALPIAVVVLALLVAGWIRRRAGGSRRPPVARPSGAKQRCRLHHDKVEFATQRDAERFVAWTQQRHRAGRWSGKPMDHCYRCPVVGRDHWHVSSKPRRPSW